MALWPAFWDVLHGPFETSFPPQTPQPDLQLSDAFVGGYCRFYALVATHLQKNIQDSSTP